MVIIDDYLPLVVPDWEKYNRYLESPLPEFMTELVEADALVFATDALNYFENSTGRTIT